MHRTIDVLAQILTVIMQIFDKLGAWIVLPAIGLVMITDVILRYVFNSPFIWSLNSDNGCSCSSLLPLFPSAPGDTAISGWNCCMW